MIRFVGLLIISFSLLASCTNDDKALQDIKNNESIQDNQEYDVENQKRIEEESQKQISHLERIIEQNKSKLKEYELKIETGDTTDIKGLSQFVEDMKVAIKNKEERLKKLKKK